MAVFPRLTPAGCSAAFGHLTWSGWDLGTLGGLVIPGKCRVTGGGIKLKHDKKSKNGSDGANPTFCGLDPQQFELEVVVWTDEQLAALYDLCRQILPLAGVESKPLVLDHPDVKHMGDVVAMQVLGAGVLKREGMMRKLEFHMLHRLPAKKKSATTTPKGSPTRDVGNKRREAAEKQNPKPTEQNISGPPANFTPGP